MDGKPVEQNPRQVLKRVIADAARDGYEMKTGVECEYFLIAPRRHGRSPTTPIPRRKPCYDQQALMRRYEVIKEICDAMIALGWKPYQNDHEDANGQFEMNWDYDDCLKTADRHAFFKFMVKSIAEKHGLRATFMPKPFANLTGNGCHAHVSLWSPSRARTCSTIEAGELGLSQARLSLHRRSHAFGRSAGRDHQSDGQLLQAHQCAAHALRRHLVAEHGDLRRQQPHAHDPHPRSPAASSSASPTARRILICCRPASWPPGLDGMRNKRDPGKRLDIDMYAEGHTVKDAKPLPLNLLDALRTLRELDGAQERASARHRRVLPAS